MGVIYLQVTKSEKFVKAIDVQEGKVIFNIIEEPNEVKGDYGIKLETRVKMSSEKGETAIARWTLNNTSKDNLINKYGTETTDWIGKNIPIVVEKISGKDAIIAKPFQAR